MAKRKEFGNLKTNQTRKKKMATSKTGGCGLSRKILTALLCVTASSFVYANELYLDQIGDSATINITQDGQDNRIGTQLNPVIIYGDAVTATINQTGSNNELDMTVNGSAASVTVNTTGNTNVQSITCGTANAAGCSGATITTTIQGDNNNVTQSLGSGGNQRSVIGITGDYTNVTHNATGGSHKADITVQSLATSATANNITVNQSGAVMQQSIVNASGSGINLNITQQQ
jgi:hypothetical protein